MSPDMWALVMLAFSGGLVLGSVFTERLLSPPAEPPRDDTASRRRHPTQEFWWCRRCQQVLGTDAAAAMDHSREMHPQTPVEDSPEWGQR